MAVSYASGSAGNPPPELSKREFANTQANMPRAWAEEAAEARRARLGDQFLQSQPVAGNGTDVGTRVVFTPDEQRGWG